MLAYAHVCSRMLCSGDEDYLVIKHTGRYTFTDTLLFDIAEANAEVHDNLLRVLLLQKCKYRRHPSVLGHCRGDCGGGLSAAIEALFRRY